MSRVLALTLGAVLITAALPAQMPDSPTGRMAGALAELAASTDDKALDLFVEQRVADSAGEGVVSSLGALRRECVGGEIAGARKSGSASAILTLALPNGRCELAYAIEETMPYRLLDLRVDVMLGGPPRGGLGLDLPKGDDAALAAALEHQLAELAARGEFSGVVLVAREGEPFFHRAFGYANRETGRLNTVETRFDIGSITKWLTRIAVAQLAQAGKIDLAATVQSVLPDYPNAKVGERITIQQLLDHGSGLGDIFNERWSAIDKSKLLTPRDFFPLFVDQPLAFEPGTRQSYSNAGFIVLGAIVEAVSGESYPDYLERHVFSLAGMNASGFPSRDGSEPSLAVGYTREGGVEARPNLGMLPLRGCPAGSSSHTAGDLLRLDRALRAGKLLDERWTGWLYGDDLARVDAGRNWPVGVAGGGPGVCAIVEGDGRAMTIVLSNTDPPTAEQLGLEIAAALRE